MHNFNVSGFLLLGFSAKPEQELLYASLFLVLYVLALTGNMLIITTTSLDDSLQSPMYFFLKHLSLLDLCYISVTVPKFIYNSFIQSGTISLWECIVQCFTLITCSSAEMAMLTLMSYDRYVAICLPLHYDVIMNVRTCVHGIAGVWISGTLSGVMHTAATFSIQFCGPRIIHQFFCDIPQLLRLSCSNDYLREIGVTVFIALLSFGCITFIGCSYVRIFSSVLRIPSAEGRTKAFSTCIPHLAVVILFACTGFFEFLKPHSDNPSALDIVLTIFYSIVPPTLNPLIYSLRNKAMKTAIRMVFKRSSRKILTGASEFQDPGDIRQELVSDTGTTEVDGESSCHMHDSRDGPTDPDTDDSMDTGSDIYDDFIAQGQADGHVVVIGYYHEYGHLGNCIDD
ncbi:olfactory receptor 14J1-like [Sorex fumeus]|uniref:olfactory receptor 14J1-like n=1 Tax=Sorex fumeus TaxID=62283 RepID=UPI0024ADD763|nr:olfactory receptor 14J1-like [Sorex fumeus]